MGIGIYPAFKPPVPDAHLGSDGKFLAKHLETLDQLARIAGVPSLGSFMDQREPDPDDEMLDLEEFVSSWDEWFPASAGMRTIEGLLSVARGPSRQTILTGDAVYLPDHLEDLLRCLRLAERRGAQFRIEVVM
jgi:hypothetical protein